ncbi:response regulator [Paenibacillus puerhi]|uniref:response regulator n=1 Tax=Paenibacillus puerhi TaxID=2692622 RepID=UPI00135BA222|nr:response regulator [Paenibacillus puerhi]
MRKVVVVDDEKWIRKGLIQSIPWERFDFKLVGEAGDGHEAYALAMAEKPDLLFLDMRMPGLDGKQLIGMLNRELPGMLTIVVSGYSDFEYTKEAIRHNAYEYLLKPVKKDELYAVLEKAEAELQRRESALRREQAERQEDWLQRAVYRSEADWTDDSGTLEAELPPEWTGGELLMLVGRQDAFRESLEPQRLSRLVRDQLDRSRPFLFGGAWTYMLASAPDASREIVLALNAASFRQEELDRLNQTLQQVFKQAGSGTYSFGVSRRKPGGLRLRPMYLEAQAALKSRRLGESASLLSADRKKPPSARDYPQELENAFLLSLQMGGGDLAWREFERLFAVLSADTVTVDDLQRSAFLLVHSIDKQLRAKHTLLQDICGGSSTVYTGMIEVRHDAASVKRIFAEEIIPRVLAFYGRSCEKQGEKVVREIRQLIESHYAQPLSLQQIAGSHYMNTDYLSRLFKKTTGQNFVDYMTDYRINKAKEWLRLPGYKNYEIAQKVGYEDYRYFSQIFKKRTGMTIGEYRSAAGVAEYET